MPVELVEKMLTGDQRALARLVSAVERQSADVPDIMQRLTPTLGRAYCIGITGPPGAGKSTLTDRLTAYARQQGKTVGIIAVDPTSPFSGGAILGDRIRMQQHYLDAGVYIRSMASRGHHGGLSRAARGVIKLLDAFGKDLILVETVGVGQTELDIVAAADTTLLVLVPESGDAIQTIKAGIMEIADLFVINKADRDGADRLQRDLQMMLHVRPPADGWCPPVLSTQGLPGRRHRRTLCGNRNPPPPAVGDRPAGDPPPAEPATGTARFAPATIDGNIDGAIRGWTGPFGAA